MSGTHFEQMAADYARARPPYPDDLYRSLTAVGVIGPGRRVLEIGAGAGLATAEIVRAGSEVVALEPGPQLVGQLRAVAPTADVLIARLEDADLPAAAFDSVVAAMSLHWVDLEVGLPKIHAVLRDEGWLASWRTTFGDDDHHTPFRRRVAAIVADRPHRPHARCTPGRPTIDELSTGGLFEPVSTEEWPWTIDLTTEQVCGLFRTFSDWSEAEVEAAAHAVDDLGGRVTEHYRTTLHLLRRTNAPG